MSPEIIENSIGAFFLQVKGYGAFNVIQFQLTKTVGMLPDLRADISDVSPGNVVKVRSSAYPKLGSIKKLFKAVSIDKGALLDCELKQIRSKDNKTIQWFRGKICVMSPSLDTRNGVFAGMSVYCQSRVCELMYSMHSDFLFTPAQLSRDVATLQKMGVFDGSFLKASNYNSQEKLQPQKTIALSGASINDDILTMLQKVLNKLANWQKKKVQLISRAMPEYNLKDYFINTWKVSKNASTSGGSKIHPYVASLCQAFFNGFRSTTILDSVVGALQSGDRMLTIVPPARGQQDKMIIRPALVSKLSGFQILQNDMHSCSMAAAPLKHLRTPDKIYTRSKLSSMYNTTGNKAYSKRYGKFQLQTTNDNKNLKLKIVDVPDWLLNTLIQSARAAATGKNDKQTPLRNLTAADTIKASAGEQKGKQAIPAQNLLITPQSQALLNAMAKTVFYHMFMQDKQANLSLAVKEKTLNIDKYLGRSIQFRAPIQASQLGGNSSTFYGVLQNVTYQFVSANDPKAKSNMMLNCTVTGVTWKQDTVHAKIYETGSQDIIYTSTGQKHG